MLQKPLGKQKDYETIIVLAQFLLQIFIITRYKLGEKWQKDNIPISYRRLDSTVRACGKAWVNCGKPQKTLWKHWGISGGKPTQKIRIATNKNV